MFAASDGAAGQAPERARHGAPLTGHSTMETGACRLDAAALASGSDHRRLKVLRQLCLMVFEARNEIAECWRVELVVVVEPKLSVQLHEWGAIGRNVLIQQFPDLDLASPGRLNEAQCIGEWHRSSVDLFEEQTSIGMAEERPVGVNRATVAAECWARLIESMAFVDHMDRDSTRADMFSFRWVCNCDGNKQDAVATDPTGNAELRAVINGRIVSHIGQGTAWQQAYRALLRVLPVGFPSFDSRPTTAAPATSSRRAEPAGRD